MKYVYDGTFTSEGLEGIHFQYALRWAEKLLNHITGSE